MKQSEFWDTCTTYNDCSICPLSDENNRCEVNVKKLEDDSVYQTWEDLR